jgi:hypothetical protein
MGISISKELNNKTMKNLLFIIAFFIPVFGFSQNETFINKTKAYIESQFIECGEFEETDTTLTVLCDPIEARFYFNKSRVCYMSTFYYSPDNTKDLKKRLLSEGYEYKKYKINGKNTPYRYIKKLGNTIFFVDISKSDKDYFCIFSKVDL